MFPINLVVKFFNSAESFSLFFFLHFYLFFCEMNLNAATLSLEEFFLLFPIFLWIKQCPAERLTHEYRLHFSISFIIKHLTVALLTINMPSMPTEVSASERTLHFTSVIWHPNATPGAPKVFKELAVMCNIPVYSPTPPPHKLYRERSPLQHCLLRFCSHKGAETLGLGWEWEHPFRLSMMCHLKGEPQAADDCLALQLPVWGPALAFRPTLPEQRNLVCFPSTEFRDPQFLPPL